MITLAYVNKSDTQTLNVLRTNNEIFYQMPIAILHQMVHNFAVVLEVSSCSELSSIQVRRSYITPTNLYAMNLTSNLHTASTLCVL